MVVAQFRQFVLAAIGLSILAFFLLGEQDILAAVPGNIGLGRGGDQISVVSYGVLIGQRRVGNDFAYTFSIRPSLRVKPQKTDTTVVAVVKYGNIEKRAQFEDGNGNYADTFLIKAGEESGSPIIRAEISTPIPLPERIDGGGTYAFTESYPYVFEDTPGSGSNFRLVANEVGQFTVKASSGDYEQACGARFIAECTTTFSRSEILTKCADPANPDQRCRDILELCGAKITLVVRDVNCGESKVTADYETECTACTKWEANETVRVDFFRADPQRLQESCVYTHASNFALACFAYRMGGADLLFDPGAVVKL